ncbi:MAG TPA: NADH-quinone oxidoreductase subunit N [Gemmatimonadales bacterium]
MTLDLAIPGQLAIALLPEIVLAVGTMALLLFAVWRPESDSQQRAVGVGALIVAFASLAAVGYMAMAGHEAPGGVLAVDNFRWAASAILLLGAILTIALSVDYQRVDGITTSETHVLVLLATSGMLLLAGSRDLVLTFLGIELMSIPVYVLAASDRRSAPSAEGGLKYFILGAFSTAFLLYGMTLIYGLAGGTDYRTIAAAVLAPGALESPLLAVGIGLLIIGFGFKVAAVPFHVWAPDAYDGAPSPQAGFMAATVKAAAFAAFIRLFVEVFPTAIESWHLALWWLAAVTMIVGNVIGLVQRNIKRLLAYSSIAHAGYILIAVVVGVGATSADTVVTGSGAFLFYLFSYTLATMGAFGVVSALGRRDGKYLFLDDYAGLWAARPGLALAMSVFMLALLGFPVFGGIGFFAKWYMIQAALRGGAEPQTRLAALLVLASVISAGYYLSVVRVMFMRPRADDAPPLPRVGGFTNAVIAGTAILILIFGFAPSQVLRAMSGSSLRPAAEVVTPVAQSAAAVGR